MATIDDHILKNFTGRIGNLVVYQRLGKTCIRVVSDYEGPTGAGQLAQQERITSVAIFYKAVCAVGLGECWKCAEKPVGWSGYNLFVKRNLPAFTGDGLIGDFSKIRLTEGKIQLPDQIELRYDEEEMWRLTWNSTILYPSCDADDRIYVALMKCEDCFEVQIPDIGDVRRKDGRAVFRIPNQWKKYTHLFVFVSSEQGECMSSSYYINHLNVKSHGVN